MKKILFLIQLIVFSRNIQTAPKTIYCADKTQIKVVKQFDDAITTTLELIKTYEKLLSECEKLQTTDPKNKNVYEQKHRGTRIKLCKLLGLQVQYQFILSRIIETYFLPFIHGDFKFGYKVENWPEFPNFKYKNHPEKLADEKPETFDLESWMRKMQQDIDSITNS